MEMTIENNALIFKITEAEHISILHEMIFSDDAVCEFYQRNMAVCERCEFYHACY